MRIAEALAETRERIAALSELVGTTWGREASDAAKSRPLVVEPPPLPSVERRGKGRPKKGAQPELRKAPAPAIYRLPVVAEPPGFVVGWGLRRETCRQYEACLRLHAQGPNRAKQARCPYGCAGFSDVTRTERVERHTAKAEGWT